MWVDQPMLFLLVNNASFLIWTTWLGIYYYNIYEDIWGFKDHKTGARLIRNTTGSTHKSEKDRCTGSTWKLLTEGHHENVRTWKNCNCYV